MRKKWLLATLGLAAVFGGVAYTQRDPIAMAVITPCRRCSHDTQRHGGLTC